MVDLEIQRATDVSDLPFAPLHKVCDELLEPMHGIHFDPCEAEMRKRALQGNMRHVLPSQVLQAPVSKANAVDDNPIDLFSQHPALIELLFGLAVWGGGRDKQIVPSISSLIAEPSNELG